MSTITTTNAEGADYLYVDPPPYPHVWQPIETAPPAAGRRIEFHLEQLCRAADAAERVLDLVREVAQQRLVRACQLERSLLAVLPGLLLDLQGWSQARQIYAVSPLGEVTNTGLQPAGPFDRPIDIVTTEVSVRSHDGAMVPMSIIHRRGTRLDGSNPVLLYGYASYGITEEPWFGYSRLAWMDAGGVFAVANPRGSGVFGRQWHEAGRQATKPNTWNDFIACLAIQL